MALIYSIGENLVSSQEFERLHQEGQILDFVKAFNKKENYLFKLRDLEIPSDSFIKPLTLAPGQVVQPSPIGIGKPLTIYIQHIYLGDNGGKALLVTSAMKPITETKPAPRAINLLKEKTKNKGHIDFSAADLGTPLVYYSPSLTESYATLTVEMILDKFDSEIFDQIGDIMQTAGKLPIFAAASPFLFAAGVISKIIGDVGESIIDGDSFFSASEKLTFDFAGMPQTLPGKILLTKDEEEEYLLANYKLDEGGKLVPNSPAIPDNVKYPYITIYLDGTVHEDYKSFKPLTDAVNILDEFFHLKTSKQQMQMNALKDAVSLYNDFSFRKQAENLKADWEEEKKKNPDSAECKNLELKYNAVIKNIQEDLFKLK